MALAAGASAESSRPEPWGIKIPACKNDCARFISGHSLCDSLGEQALPPSQAYFFFAAFFLAFFFAFAMLALQLSG